MERDETGTLHALQACRRETIDPLIAANHGRIVKLMGDGALVEFASVVDAVECALAMQAAMAARNAPVSEDLRIRFRIGIHIGDVIAQGVIAAVKEVGLEVPLVVRLEGTNVKEGKALLEGSDLPITTGSSLRDAAQKIVEMSK